MKTKLASLFAVASILTLATPSIAAEPVPVATELRELVGKVQAKIKDGNRNEAALADELKEFDAIIARHKDEKTDEVARVLMMKAMLYSQVLNNEAKSAELMEQLKRDFPDTKVAASLKRLGESEKVRASLAKGSAFPDFDVKDTEGKALSVSGLKGKVVLIDFWATWCGPCVAELPNVLEAYEKHHATGFEIIGISLDKDRAKLDKFVAEKKMTWPQFFDGKGWENELAQKYGVNSIPATFLLDRDGKIIGSDLRGEALEKAVAAALAKK